MGRPAVLVWCNRTAEVSTPENMSQFTNVGEGLIVHK